MVKGVHKKIIEVKTPGGDYFEKAVFYLRPGVTGLPPEITEAAAQMAVEELIPAAQRKVWKKIVFFSGIALSAVLIAAIAFILIL